VRPSAAAAAVAVRTCASPFPFSSRHCRRDRRGRSFGCRGACPGVCGCSRG
jgi:hypothetical protein